MDNHSQEIKSEFGSLPDQELVARALRGDREGLETLVQRYLGLVYGIAQHYVGNADDAEDVTQETFIKVWKNLKKFQPEKNFKNWVWEIAKNTSLDWLKKKRLTPLSNFETADGENPLADTIADAAPTPFERAHTSSVLKNLQSAIARLSPAYQEVLVLRGRRELTFPEIAAETNQSANTVKSRYRRALRYLRALLKGK